MEWKKIVTGHELADGFECPRGRGVSYFDMLSDRYILHPIPFNNLVSAGRWLIKKLRRPYFDRKEWGVIHRKMTEQWQRGYDMGYEHGCKNTVEKLMEDYEELRKKARIIQ